MGTVAPTNLSGGGRPARRSPPLLLRWALRAAAVYLLLVVAMLWLERWLIFFPDPAPAETWTPSVAGLEQVEFAADGARLRGWYFDCPAPRGVAMFFPGNAGNVSYWLDELVRLRDDHRLAILAADYRGYGRSEGRPSEPALCADARAGRAWLARRCGVAEADVILFGRSLGGAVAIDLAGRDGARALVVQSTFTSLPDVAAVHYPWLPVHWGMRTRFESVAKLPNYTGPLLMSHGDADEVVPFDHAERLLAAAPGRKQFVRIPGGGHNDPQPDAYYDALDEFLGSLAPLSAEPAARDAGPAVAE